jgi:predicted enzyme related to lactoylglutathione lyase
MIDYPPGTPCWVELSSPDPDASARFYGELFGWEADAGGADGRRAFRLGGAEVAGLAPLERGRRTSWMTYIAVADAAATVDRAEAAGGTTLLAPLELTGTGTMAILTDGADGAVFALLQPGQLRGAQVVNTAGALTMNELATRDLDGAARFYGEVFGWEVERIEVGGRVVYGSVRLDGRLVAGMLPMGAQVPPEVPANWVPYFGVEDVQAAREQAAGLGAQVLMEEMQVPAGRFSVLSDPHGAAFCAFQGTFDPPPGA